MACLGTRSSAFLKRRFGRRQRFYRVISRNSRSKTASTCAVPTKRLDIVRIERKRTFKKVARLRS